MCRGVVDDDVQVDVLVRARERLTLRLLVDRHHDGLVGRIQIEADDVNDLLVECGILADLERSMLVRFDIVLSQHLVCRRPPDAELARE